MNFSNLSKFVGAGVIAASLTVVPLTLPAHAQNNTSDTSTQQNGTATQSGPISTNTERDHNNWGWLGLIGIAGLAGLAKKKHQEVHHVSNDPNVGVRSGTDFR